MNYFRLFLLLSASLVAAPASFAQLFATDNFESYAGDPVGSAGGSGDWTTFWTTNTQFGGGTFLSPDAKISGANSIGLFGGGSTSGTSVRRAIPDLTTATTIRFSMRADYDVTSASVPTNVRRMAFTIRAGNGDGHFDHQLLSFYFAAGSGNFFWYDGANRTNTALTFATGHVYDVRVTMTPSSRQYTLVASNRTTSVWFSYDGAWFTGADGQAIGSVAFLMRGPSGAGNDAFLDDVDISSPGLTEPPGQLPVLEGSFWRYFKGTSTPATQGTNQWYHGGFNDNAWFGPSPSGFGYGDCDDATTLSDMQNNYRVVFTRKTFIVTNASAISRLTLAVDFDDGILAYLNGTEIARSNLPAGAVSHTTSASGNHESSRGESSGNPRPREFITVNPSLLVNGTNLLAVSGHNVSSNSSDFTLIAELHANASLIRGPFIQMPDPGNKAMVAWSTAGQVDGAVDYGLDLSYSGGTVSNGALVRDHALVLSGLLPGTTYYYRVRSHGEILSAGQSFTTRASADQPFRFAVIGDHGQGTEWMYNIANRLNQRHDFDLLLTVGDNIYGSTLCNVDGAPGWYDPFWFRLYGPTMKRAPVFPALGNHDKDTANGQYQVDYFYAPTNGPVSEIEKNYTLDYGNVQFIIIDSDPFQNNETAVMASITSWLSNAVAQSTQTWKIALFHHPAFTSQGNHNDNERVKAQIIPILKAHGVQYIFEGHNHFYERINAINGIHYNTCGACGAFLYGISNRKEYSAQLIADKHSYSVVDINGGRLKLEQFSENDTKIDEFNLDIHHAFAIDGLLDNPGWLRAQNNLQVYAAIRGFNLYVATQDAGEGNDHFIYIADALSTQRPANWAKSGTIMQWGAMLADENDGGFQGWFGPDQQALTDFDFYKSMTSGLNNNAPYGANGVLEGSLDLPGHFGTFPQQLYIAAAPFGTADGGTLVASAQVPAGNGDGDIQANEFLLLNARDIALDLPVAEAGSSQSVEAGMWAVLDGGNSAAPSGLPLTYQWQPISGPAITTTNTGTLMPALVITSNVVTATNVVLRLRVNDGRFDSDDDFVTVTLIPAVDSDSDGLTDNEEITGFDNILTPANPNGITSNPLDADSDGDGMNDGDEHLSGTNPGDPASIFKIVSQLPANDGNIHIDWNTVSGLLYEVNFADNSLTNPWTQLISFTATSALSRITDTNTGAFIQRYYRIDLPF